jgi:nitrite reductase/ring-hydroxylating ferredoxin subunit
VKKDNWYIATGFQKWGMTTAMVSALIISDQIMGKENEYEFAFSPQRFLLRAGFKNFWKDAWESVVGLGGGLYAKKEEQCTHVGCALHWNAEEESWDCACHGSRYGKTGEVLDGPTKYHLRE